MVVAQHLAQGATVSDYTFFLPSPPASSSSPPVSGAPARQLATFGLTDQEFDPRTRDYVDTEDGAWSEVTDSRTSVLMQLESRLNEWAGDETAGSLIRAKLESGDPVSAGELRDEALRALQVLVGDGTLADLVVTIDEDEVGRVVIGLVYRDRATARRLEQLIIPFGG